MTTQLHAVHGRINDLDSHLQVPVSKWGDVFGEATAQFGQAFAGIPLFDVSDEPELTVETVWQTKGSSAPGASTPEGRLAAMDVMGIEQQIIFPKWCSPCPHGPCIPMPGQCSGSTTMQCFDGPPEEEAVCAPRRSSTCRRSRAQSLRPNESHLAVLRPCFCRMELPLAARLLPRLSWIPSGGTLRRS